MKDTLESTMARWLDGLATEPGHKTWATAVITELLRLSRRWKKRIRSGELEALRTSGMAQRSLSWATPGYLYRLSDHGCAVQAELKRMGWYLG
jgi:hypothetical protein